MENLFCLKYKEHIFLEMECGKCGCHPIFEKGYDNTGELRCECYSLNLKKCNCSFDAFIAYNKKCVSCFYKHILKSGPNVTDHNNKYLIGYVLYNLGNGSIIYRNILQSFSVDDDNLLHVKNMKELLDQMKNYKM